MRIYVTLNKDTGLWTVAGSENYGHLAKTVHQALPVTREEIGITAGLVMNQVVSKRNKQIVREVNEAPQV